VWFTSKKTGRRPDRDSLQRLYAGTVAEAKVGGFGLGFNYN